MKNEVTIYKPQRLGPTEVMTRIDESKFSKSYSTYITEVMEKMTEALVINQDHLFIKSPRSATEARLECHNDRFDALNYSQLAYRQVFDIAWISQVYAYEQKLKITKGKVCRKIRRQLKKLKGM